MFLELLRPTRSLIADPILDAAMLHRANLFTFTFVRHPFERLASAFHDKFVTKKNEVFLKPLVRYNLDYGSGRRKYSFETFVNFVLREIDDEEMSEGSLHWWPYTRLCKMCQVEYRYIGKLEVRQFYNLK